MTTSFKEDIIEGLKKPQKRLPSKYFYDEEGDKIFQQIMRSEAYYLPGCELNILNEHSSAIMQLMPANCFHVIELGAGDGTKTAKLLQKLIDNGKEIIYYPLDISEAVLETNKSHMQSLLPTLGIKPIPGDYFETLKHLHISAPKVLLFLGSNIGNFTDEKAIHFLSLIRSYLNEGDMLLMGIDLRKNPKKILAAYNDDEGLTKKFNLNLLRRINTELTGNFDLSKFDHYPHYDPIAGTAYSYIVSLEKQEVEIAGENILFEANELIHTEISKKYSLKEIEHLSMKSGYRKVTHILDEKQFYSVSAFIK